MKAKEMHANVLLYKNIVKAKFFIDTHYAENIHLNEVADRACLSKFHFIRIFKKTYGLTPNQYLTNVRIGKAKLLLEAGFSISDACFLTGYDSVSTFKSLFKKKTLSTPLAFKNLRHNKKKSMKENPHLHIPSCLVKKRW